MDSPAVTSPAPFEGLPLDGPTRAAWRRVQPELVAAAAKVQDQLNAQYAQLSASRPKAAKRFIRAWPPGWAKKYLSNAPAQIGKWKKFIPYLAGVKQGYEIGVGPGYLFRLLTDVYGARLTGCDVEPGQTLVFDALRRELGIADRVQVHSVRPQEDIPITEGSDTLIAFRTSFSDSYTVPDYQWLFDHCRERLTGEKQVVLMLNRRCYDIDGVEAFFSRRADFPFLDPARPALTQHWDSRTFCRLSLA